MKRFLCMLVCLMLIMPMALAAGDETPSKKFRTQIVTGGNGIRGTLTLSASGVAKWVEVLLPFTATTLNVRAIGEKQGDQKMSEMITDDDDWQIKLYAKDAQDQQRAVTYLYGTHDAIFLSSELLPDVLLTLPVEGVHLLYQPIRGEMMSMLTTLDPLSLMTQHDGGNIEAYSALSSIAQIDEAEWAEEWEPVLAKYYTELDMWLSLYAAEPTISGTTGSLTMSSAYCIPAADVKAEAKKLVGMMLFDSELLNLLAPHVTMDQRVMYLNPSMVYFYEYCIDALALEGDILMEREMTAKGETIGMSVSLPMPELPEEVTSPLGEMLAGIFQLPYTDLLSDLQRITFQQAGGDVSITVASPQRSISFVVDETASNAETVNWEGFVRITPAVGSDEPLLSAAFTYKTSHRLWQDDEWVDHEDYSCFVSVEPDTSMMSADDPFLSSYVDFPPVTVDAALNYSRETDKPNRPVELAIRINAILPDAELGIDANLRSGNPWEHVALPTTGGEDMRSMSEERVNELLLLLTKNAVQTMSTLNLSQPDADAPTVDEATTKPAAAEPTIVPPME